MAKEALSHLRLDESSPSGGEEAAPRARGSGLRADLRRLRRLFRYMKPYRRRLISGLVLGAVYGAISGALPKAIEVVSRRLFESDQPASLGMVVATSLAIPVYFALRGSIGFLNTYCLRWVSGRILRDIRVEIFNHLQLLSMDFFVRQRVPTLMQRVHNNTARMQRAMVGLAGDVVKQPITILVAIVVLAVINIWFCLFALAIGALCLIPMLYFGKKVRQASREEVKSEGALLGVLHETLSNIRVVKAYVLEKYQSKRFRKATEHQMSRMLRFQKQQELLSPLIELIGSAGIAATFVYVHFSGTSLSELLAVVAGFFMIYEPLKRLGSLHVRLQRVLDVSERVFGILDTPTTTMDHPDAVELPEFRESIRYENVSLGYDPDQEVLRDINLTIPHGTICALVGPSGSGKTSMVNLLLRFYDPTRGTVRIDGQDVRRVKIKSLRRLFGLVTQETILFADTVASNIGYGKRGVSRDEIVEAATQAQAHDFIMEMPNGYDTVLMDRGQNLSGGQRQRIAIARAFLKNPAILVLDEATSSLDADSERKVQQAMNRLMQGRTVVIIAHRLSTVRHADEIIVFGEGQIQEAGGHKELIDQDGLYRRLHDLQVMP